MNQTKKQSSILALFICFSIVSLSILMGFPLSAEAAIQEYTLTGHTAYIRSIDISTDGKYLVSGGEDRVAKVWDLSNGSTLRTLTSYTEIDNKNHTHTIEGHKKDIFSVAFSQDGKLIATGGDDGHIKIWQTDTGKINLSIDSSSGCFSVKFSHDGKYVADGGIYDNLSFWGTDKGELNGHTLGVTSLPFEIAFSNDNNIVAAGNDYGKIQLWKNKSGVRSELRTLSQRNKWNGINAIAFSPDDKLLVAVSNAYPDKASNNLKLWEVDTGRLIWSIAGDSTGLNSVAFSPDGKSIATLGENLKLWSISGDLVKDIPLKFTSDSKFRSIQKVRILNDGKIVACKTDGNNIKVWIVTE
jgi:WD40 repeat protein